MSEWKECRLGEIVDVIDSLHQTPKYSNIGYPMVRVTDIKGGYLETGNTLKVDKHVFEVFSKKHKPKKGDIVMSRVGSYGISCIVKNDINFCLGQNTLFLVPKQNPEFLYYFLNSPDAKSQIESKATGTTQKTISLKSIKEIKVCLPSIALQTAIAEILSSLDDKIELNNKINQELETLAQTLFKQWFIDFEFPNENGEPYKSSGGEMVESELGEIPMGWTTEVLSETTKLIRGISYRKPELVLEGEGVAFVNLKCFSITGAFRQDGIKYYNGKYKHEQILTKNDILVAVTDLTQDREIIGMPILWNGGKTALPSLDTCIIRSETLELKNFLYYEFKTKRYKSRIIEHANGSTVLHLSVKGLETYIFPLPNDEILVKWFAIIQPILETINSNINETYELSKTRDTLLPKLISGELEINEIPS
ncbi:restriction endonuclease subunit S [Aquirufa ecclesiirivi]|uniref:restriction endonuclease subunit S n=1 Tax=Aquirufa ecclesiirivi TaxID=2715124 RepID=UPI0023D8AB9E|nr:restriction endonuclease subunit S [Aquirufa ecclesiirivi]MDF0692692.1 restriction endonuclease subunit S [Aquirufa ecclesiirivi]